MTQQGSVVLGNSQIDFSIQRTGRRKTIGITVNPDSSVTVAAPKGTRRTLIAQKVNQKAEWVLQQRERLRRNGQRASRQFVSGETFHYLGRQHQLKLVSKTGQLSTTQAAMNRGRLVVPVASRWAQKRRNEEVKAALENWYREHALAHIVASVDRFSKRLGVAAKSVELREMKTRWGSGGTDGRLRFNWRIAMAPKRLLEYVVAHELCHIRFHDHSREFWRLLSRVMPDYQQRRHELEKRGPSYDLR